MAAGMKMKSEVNYTPGEEKTNCCKHCEFYDYSRCQLVAGAIDRNGTCSLFSSNKPPKKSGTEEFTCSDPC